MNTCLPVAQELHAKGWDVHFLALTTAYTKVAASGFTVWQAADLVHADEAEIIELGAAIAGNVTPGGPVSVNETYAYHGLGYFALVAEHGSDKAKALYRAHGRAAFAHGEMAARLLDIVQPDIVMTTNSPRAEKALIDGAQSRGIAAAVLNDTLASASNHWLHQPHYADRICVLSEAVRTILIQSGHAPGKVVVTGNPAFDAMADLRIRRDQIGFRGVRTILYASQPLPPEDAQHKEQVMAQLRLIAADRADLKLRIRLHPNEVEADAVGPEISAGTSLAEDLLACDVVVTHGSTVGIEAALAGIPVVLQKGTTIAELCRFEDYGIAMANEHVTGLEMVIDRALALGVASQFSMPENSIGNIIAVLEEMIDQA
ncbi:hypothetical protein [Qipengyuania sp. ASV99]|uniref:hypothetical protein n=1 Tax=Qipengyuania sp. ASV99 TaxID=3399681 RepID=UPI003A4C7511